MDTGPDDQRQEVFTDSTERHRAPVVVFFSELAGSILRTTKRFFKNLIPSIRNKYRRWRNERNRLPKRTTRSKAYLLVGYTTKEHIDKRYRAMKLQNIIRVVFLISILVLTIYVLQKWLNPFGNTDELKQIIGIEGIDELTEEDPFSKNANSENILIKDNSVQVTVPSSSGESSSEILPTAS